MRERDNFINDIATRIGKLEEGNSAQKESIKELKSQVQDLDKEIRNLNIKILIQKVFMAILFITLFFTLKKLGGGHFLEAIASIVL